MKPISRSVKKNAKETILITMKRRKNASTAVKRRGKSVERSATNVTCFLSSIKIWRNSRKGFDNAVKIEILLINICKGNCFLCWAFSPPVFHLITLYPFFFCQFPLVVVKILVLLFLLDCCLT